MSQLHQILGPSENIVHDEREGQVLPRWKLYVGYAEGFGANMVNSYSNSGKGAVVMISRGNYGHGLQDEILRSIAKEYKLARLSGGESPATVPSGETPLQLTEGSISSRQILS